MNAKKENANFRQARRFHREGILSLKDYFNNIVELYQFEPKKKYVETLINTDESDATTISDSSDEESEINELSEQLNNSTLESREPHSMPPANEPDQQQTQTEDNAVCNLCLKTFKKGAHTSP